jgi:hypothetical protein
MVFVFLTVSLAVLIAALAWTQTSSTLIERQNRYFRTVAAAEAATEKVLAQIAQDYQKQGESLVLSPSRLELYRTLIPTVDESPVWARYEFRSPQGEPNRVLVEYVPPTEFRQLSSTYRGLRGYASKLRIIANAREVGSQPGQWAGVCQEVEVATIPVFQFAVFYNMDLEINPGPNMTITGPVHCNANIFLQPVSTLIFQSDVTAAAQIIHDKKPGDPLIRNRGTIIYQAEHDSGVSSLTLPIGTNNTPPAVREVVELPSPSEPPGSAMAKERYYNKADMIILITNNEVRVSSGSVNNFSTVIPWSQASNFISTNVSFYNKREEKTINTVQIDIGKLRQWNETNILLRTVLLPHTGGDIRTIYVADLRPQSPGTQSGVRLINGQELLPQGLTVATPNPLYIQGHYNAPAPHLGTTNTSQTKPASIVADAITILSTAWSDANSRNSLSKRVADNTTVNAAFLAGIVPTTDGSYSGGLENFPRFLENWSGKTFTYNGSMVVMYQSRYATGPWRGTGSTIGIYNPPVRQWAFDPNFCNPSKLPPGCPSVRVLVRGKWSTIRPGATSLDAR